MPEPAWTREVVSAATFVNVIAAAMARDIERDPERAVALTAVILEVAVAQLLAEAGADDPEAYIKLAQDHIAEAVRLLVAERKEIET